MGCDLHRYVEYKGTGDNWSSTPISGLGKRNYDWFGFICKGVRRDHDPEEYHVHEPIGFPDDAGLVSFHDFFIPENENKNKSWYGKLEQYLKRGKRYSLATGKEEDFIQHPDYYGATYIYLDEFLELLDSFKKFLKKEYSEEITAKTDINNWTVELDAIADYMKAYEKQGFKTRIVYWFDG